MESKKVKTSLLLIFAIVISTNICQSQIIIGKAGEPINGFVYSPGIGWTENKTQDSVLRIVIEKDTMTAIRNLLNYCLQEKAENDNASILLSMINLEYLKTIVKRKEFNFYLAEYKKTVARNKKARNKLHPEYGIK